MSSNTARRLNLNHPFSNLAITPPPTVAHSAPTARLPPNRALPTIEAFISGLRSKVVANWSQVPRKSAGKSGCFGIDAGIGRKVNSERKF